MKKVLSLVVVLALVLGSFGMAFAAPADVKGTNDAAAVSRLTALGVITGYADGTFKPNQPITRAEFAAIVVRSLGLETTAGYLKGAATPFKDVTGDHWASGYISIAASKGIINGVGDNKFAPSANVSYQEASTMVVRALGYTELPGTWPYNYIVQGQSLGLYKNVDFVPTANALRGDIASIVSAALDQKLVTWNEDKKRYDKEDTTLLGDAFDKTFVTKIVTDVPAIDKALDSNEIKLDGTKVTLAANAELVGADDFNALLGYDVKVLYNDDDEVMYIQATTSSDNIIQGTIYATDAASVKVDLNEDDDVADTNETTALADGAIVVKNNAVAEAKNITADDSVKAFLNADGKVRFVILNAFDVKNGLVVETKAINKTKKFYGSVEFTTIVENDATGNYEETTATLNLVENAPVVRDGKAATLADLAENDVIYIKEDTTGKVTYIEAYSNTVEGKVTTYRTKGGFLTKVTVNGTEYSVVSNYVLALTAGSNVTLHLNKDGKVRLIEVAADSKVSGFFVEYSDVSTLKDGKVVETNYATLKVDGEEKEYAIDSKTNMPAEATLVDKYVTLAFDSDNEVKTFTVHAIEAAEAYLVAEDDADVDASTLIYDADGAGAGAATTYRVTSSTKFIDSVNQKTVAFADIKKGQTIKATIASNGLDLKVVMITAEANASAVKGIFVEKYAIQDEDSDAPVYYVTLNVKGEEKAYKVASEDDYDAITADAGNFVKLTFTGSKVSTVAAAAVAPNIGRVTKDSVDGDKFSIDANKYIVTSSTVIYVVDEDGVATIGTIADVDDTQLGTEDSTSLSQVEATVDGKIGDYNKVTVLVIYQN